MSTRLQSGRWPAWIVACLVVAILYFGFGELDLALAFVSPFTPAVWSPTGLAIAALLLLGYRVWPGIALGVFLVNVTATDSPIIGLGFAFGNTLGALTAAYLVNTFARGRHAFERPQDVFRFVILAALLSTMISASIDVLVLGLVGAADWSDVGPIWFTWWLGAAAGALLVAPLLIVWATQSAGSSYRGQLAEGVALVLALILTSLVMFGGMLSWSLTYYPVEFLVVPALIWAGYRFGPRGAATAIFLLAAIAIRGTLSGFGPFAIAMPNTSLLLVQAFLGVMAVMTLVLAAAVLDQQHAEQRTRAAEERLRLAEIRARQEEEQRANEAEAARDQLRDFVGMVVHDLRNPLTAALGYAQLARRQVAEASTGQTALARIESSLMAMRRLVEDLLDAARIGGGRFVVRRRRIDLLELVKNTVEEQKEVDASHTFVVEGSEHLTCAWDPDRLRQVVVNLLSNAGKYSPAGTEVRVRLETIDSAALLAVTDQGVGIAADQLGQLFQPFARLGQAHDATGTGLGLFITKGIVEAHGGRIWVESAVGRGSTFFVELPCQICEDAAPGCSAG